MPHATPLIATVVAGLTLAFLFGALAQRLRIPPLVGYLMAGVAVGPFTPGYVADQHLANELAELGVILLMFGVGLHFSVRDLMAVRKIAIPGAIAQIGVAILMGIGLAAMLGWSVAGGFVFGLALSVASTVVLLRALQERNILDTDRGKIAVGWLIVEDLVMVLALVLLPALAQGGGSGAAIGTILALTVGKVAAFVAFMLIVGRRLIPRVLHYVAHTGSRELFRLAVLAIALGVAFGAAMLFGVSFALGAFFAGMILAESPLSQRAANETLPLRDAFAVLFFVSVGMLFNPHVLTDEPIALLGTVAIIVVGKSVAAWAIVLAFRHSGATALTIAASLAQIGEFSFILATMGHELALIPAVARDLVLAGAIISILLNPLLFAMIGRYGRKWLPEKLAGEVETPPQPSPTGHVVLIGYGRVGALVGRKLLEAGERVTIIEAQPDASGLPEHPNATVLVGNACAIDPLGQAGLEKARLLCIAIAEGFEVGQIVERARSANPAMRIIARAQGAAEVEHFCAKGADVAITGEGEIAKSMVDYALERR
ncbi:MULTISPECIES: YbaL family putative K(+) efflux transporter [unclassified Sphingomonas]|uniref:YbaL family putative K(+) efflux transporter n=1 Tax=unclassified Sphingomonas TaxID=196159 RepID=UPI0006F65E2A|nr:MULTISPECIES: YbaL family putative K(+) efflux transporter [unclassified Sphingomonas]KQX19986.1 sodium:proton antiporter [Sphingomonas sp. Root1294]KQY67234.1 sodium:proton antiporter [Sphingomonas sp. Root50]KRB90608.1 sodium:proton antiporter [Sphingomonas sp. Root720]